MKGYLGAIVAGLVFGIVDRWLAHGPTWCLDVFNLGALWLAAAMWIGVRQRSAPAAAASGFVLLGAALVGYYGWMYVFEGYSHVRYLSHRAAPWLVASTVVGPLFGWLGSIWSRHRAVVAPLALGTAFVVDGLGYLVLDGTADQTNAAVHAAAAVVGVAVTVVMLVAGRATWSRPAALRPAGPRR